MPLHISQPGDDEFTDKFTEAGKSWNLEKLYQDIVSVKQQERRKQRKQLTPVEKACLRGLLCGYSPAEIAKELNREVNGLRVELSRGLYRYIETLTVTCIKNWSNASKVLENAGYKYSPSQDAIYSLPAIQNQIEWGEAIDVSIFYDRTEELTKLKNWIQQDKCRLIALLGLGGIGKTALSVKLAQQFMEAQQPYFDFIIWQSLRDSTPPHNILDTLIKFLSCQQDTKLPETIGGKISRLIEYLRNYRCLIVLDNFDSVLSRGQLAGSYRVGYEEYGELLRRVGEVPHQSCLLLTSSEKPTEIAMLTGEFLPVRCLQLSGLNNDAARNLLASKGVYGTVDEIDRLVKCYNGKPLAVKIAANAILDLFDGNIAQFLASNITIFNGIRNFLDCQFQRLSPLEQEVMYWLCIHGQPVQVRDVQDNILPGASKANFLEILESLTWRSLIESNVTGLTLQAVMIEYLTNRIIIGIVEEIISGEINLLNQYALITDNIKDDMRKTNIRVFINPILANLKAHFKNQFAVEEHLQRNLHNWLENYIATPGYCGYNLVNLLHQLQNKIDQMDIHTASRS